MSSTTTHFDTVHGRGDAMPLHRHSAAYAALVVDGDHLQFGPEGPVHCVPGTLVVHPGFHVHGNRFGAHGATVMNVELPSASASATFGAWRLDDLAAAREVFRAGPHGLARLAELLGSGEAVGALPQPDWQVAFVDALAGDEPIVAVAHRVGVSVEHASRCIRRAYGLSPQALRRERRWRQAYGLMADAGRTLADVAAAAGFADQSHLTRVTRLCAGCTPATLRARINCVQDGR